MFAETIRFGQARGDVRTDIDAGRAGRVLLDAYVGALVRWAADEGTEATSLRETLGTVLDVTLAGLVRRG